MRILVTGGGGFVGHHLVRRLKHDGHFVRSADLKYPEYSKVDSDEFYLADLRNYSSCISATANMDLVYNLAADMGGIGYITSKHAEISYNNSLINLYMLEASKINKVRRFLFSSSACIYPQYKQLNEDVAPLKEEDGIPADPEPGYGWEKLYAEQLCQYYRMDHRLDTRIVRFHNVYGPEGTYDRGKEKAPAALCRKIVLAVSGDTIEIWGDGKQTRSFMHIDDCVEGLIRLMQSDYVNPLNLGTDRLVSINELVDIIARIAGKEIKKSHDLSKPQGVRGRNSCNDLIKKVLNWEPKISLEDGLRTVYDWILSEVRCEISASA